MSFFFFQAEDGIRDVAVTGVQTCALPICGYVGTDFALDDLIDRHTQEETCAALEEVLTATALAGKGGRMIAARSQFRGRTRDGDVQAYVRFLMEETDLRLGRSEERRVGKGCGGRWGGEREVTEGR